MCWCACVGHLVPIVHVLSVLECVLVRELGYNCTLGYVLACLNC